MHDKYKINENNQGNILATRNGGDAVVSPEKTN